MSITVQQSAVCKGDSWWKWSVWLDGPQEELDEIEAVEYILHPTFVDPVRLISDRKSQFRLDSAGWGEFTIYLNIKYKNGKTRKREHYLKLDPPAGKEKPSSKEEMALKKDSEKPPVLFMSSGVADAPFAKALSRALREKGVKVHMADELFSGGEPWEATLDSFLPVINAAVFVISDKASSWVNREIKAVQTRGIPITPILVGTHPKVPDMLTETQGITLKLKDVAAQVDKVSDKVVNQIVAQIYKHGGLR